jgi:hypothetical protein
MRLEELSAEQEAEAQRLAEVIREATHEDFLRIARLLVTRKERDLFGQAEFTVRDILLRAGAKAYQAHLAEKKTATRARA